MGGKEREQLMVPLEKLSASCWEMSRLMNALVRSPKTSMRRGRATPWQMARIEPTNINSKSSTVA